MTSDKLKSVESLTRVVRLKAKLTLLVEVRGGLWSDVEEVSLRTESFSHFNQKDFDSRTRPRAGKGHEAF